MDGVSPLCGYAAVEAVLWIGEWHCPVQKTAWYKQHTKYCVSCLYQHNEKMMTVLWGSILDLFTCQINNRAAIYTITTERK